MSQIPPSQYPPQSYPPQGGVGPAQMPKGNGAALASLILGILGCVPFITSLLAVILGFIGIRKTRDPRVGGKGMAIAGLVLGFLGLILWGLFGGGIMALMVGTKPIRDAGKQFLTVLSSGQTTEAAALCTSNITVADCDKLYASIKSLGPLKDVTAFGTNVQSAGGASTGVLGGAVTFTNGAKPFAMELVKENGVWKVRKIEFDPKGGVPAGP